MDGPRMGGEDEAVAAINIVPLVDVILVVLIIFMVTSVFSAAKAENLILPKGSRASVPQPPAQITVSVDKDMNIMVNGIRTDFNDVKDRIDGLKNTGEDSKTIVTLQGDKEVIYGKLMPVLQTVSGEGIELMLAFEAPKK